MAKASLNLDYKIIEVPQYSNMGNSVTFSFNRYTNNGLDLGSLVGMIILDTINIIKSNVDDSMLKQSGSDTKINLTWTFDNTTTYEAGYKRFQIVFANDDEEEIDIKAYTEVGKLIVKDGMNVEAHFIPQNLSLLKQWENRIEADWENKVNTMKGTITSDVNEMLHKELSDVFEQDSRVDELEKIIYGSDDEASGIPNKINQLEERLNNLSQIQIITWD